MKSIFLIAGLAASASPRLYEVRNYIKNGDFCQNSIGGGYWTITKELPGWEIPG